VIVDRVAHRDTWRKRFEKLLRAALSPLYTGVKVVTLLKIDVLKQVATDSSRWNRIPKHLDAGNVWNCPFYRHQPLT
jgi:hypothetical protein